MSAAKGSAPEFDGLVNEDDNSETQVRELEEVEAKFFCETPLDEEKESTNGNFVFRFICFLFIPYECQMSETKTGTVS